MKRKLKTSPAQRASWKNWAAENPEKAQATRNAYWKTAKGKAAIKRRRKKFNAYRKRWRAQKAKSGNGELTDAGPVTPGSRETQSRHSVQ